MYILQKMTGTHQIYFPKQIIKLFNYIPYHPSIQMGHVNSFSQWSSSIIVSALSRLRQWKQLCHLFIPHALSPCSHNLPATCDLSVLWQSWWRNRRYNEHILHYLFPDLRGTKLKCPIPLSL